jgi:hypothetical protein
MASKEVIKAEDKAILAYAKKIVDAYDRNNPYGKVGSGVRGIIEADLRAIEAGDVKRAAEIITEDEIEEYAL